MFLSDAELHELLDPPSKVIDGLRQNAVVDSPADPIQPASVDLTIGGIYLPDSCGGEHGSVGHPIAGEHLLDSGKTAVVETRETCHLPADIGAIGFPPATVSAGGLLTTNPGHIDPGYHGKLSFTVINMGKRSFPLRCGEEIVTLLLFRMSERSRAPYDARRPGVHGAVAEERLDKLSRNFLDVDERARRAVKEAEFKARVLTAGVPIIVSLVTLVGVLLTSYHTQGNEISKLQQEVKVLQTKIDLEKLLAAIDAKKQSDTVGVTVNLGKHTFKFEPQR
jgi:dCTP deaminase